MFLLPSLPFGSASGGKTQPLLHPSPADRDERGGLMQSSWAALRPAPLTRPPTQRNRSAAAAASSPPCAGAPRDLPGLGERCCSSSCALSRSPSSLPALLGPPRCCQRMGIPWDLQHPALHVAGGDGGLARGPPALAFAMAEPLKPRLCVCSGAASVLCACWKKHFGGRHRETLPLTLTLAAAGEGASGLCPAQAQCLCPLGRNPAS